MTTYATYKCDVCDRSIETEVDPRRPTFTHCNITYKCLGRLKFQGTKSVRTHLITSPVVGLTDWKPRNLAPVRTVQPADATQVSACNGPDILTIAVPNAGPTAQVLTMVLESENTTPVTFNSYSYYGSSGAVTQVFGSDSSSEKKILRFNASGPTPDKIAVTVNGVVLNKAVRAAAHAVLSGDSLGSIVIDQEGSLYDEPPRMIFGGNGSGAAAKAVITDGAVIDTVITSVGNNYTGTLPVSFEGGITSQTVYYLGNNSIEFEPALPAGSRIDIAVTPYVEPTTINLTFTRHSLAHASDGAWSNISAVNRDGAILTLFSSSDLSSLNMGTHLTPRSLLSNGAQMSSEWVFVISQPPHQNVDRKYSLILNGESASLYRGLNSLNSPDILVEKTSLNSIYPPFLIIAPRLIPDAVDTTTVSRQDDDTIDTNVHILGLAQ